MNIVSLFAGIGGFDLGFERAGHKTVAVVEQDKNCLKLLAAKFPAAKQFNDVRTVGAHNLPPCEIIVGGFPCQDLSVAGKRGGLAGKRSGLFYEHTRITHELQPAYLIWENVPGLLSSESGHDFLAVLAELRRIGYSGGWRTFDAQHFGVAQRRRRVFGVFSRLDSGAERCAEILSLREGMHGHPAPSREAGERPSGTITRCALDGSSACGGDGRENLLQVTHTLRAEGFDASEDGTGRGVPLIAAALHTKMDRHNGQDDGGGFLVPIVAKTLTTRNERNERNEPTTETLIPCAQSFNWQSGGDCRGLELNLKTQALTQTPAVLAFSAKDSGTDCGELSPTLRSGNHHESHQNGGVMPAIVTTLAIRGRGDSRNLETRNDGTANAILTPNGGRDGIGCGAVAISANQRGEVRTREVHGSLSASKSGKQFDGVLAAAIRRLTPRECERLQGFPDDWTAGFADSVRYRMLGNAVAVPCSEWIARRIK